ncbi:UDP-N-acetylmuramate dehydrogenase [Pelobacter propionicus DSM 2379]|uniref:UDP-N-acetylenolpyruvoylglucosamine reductase n=2 Tax=Pelobacter propionicus TaxID=29543 RepID=MURB_PELPD|nr:RecName: Full=UDP-N-acetylenolpyruvoylglucosamine reductase; AltName: Full=UDP-N-acetylmuramate dehydrogenase [Pelobacter propionicus DSM 2379]ABL00880.1 UDP-N-acetylmuramate dehydrogenase [Pelobacter propionicus DSM 2379]
MNLSGLNMRGLLLADEPMSRHTSLRVGGPADLFAIPEDADDLQGLLRQLKERGIPWLAIGRGNNLLVRDSGIRGAVISLERFNRVEALGQGRIRAGAGAENLAVVRFAQEQGLGGIGFISGIPGTVGGAIRMNAGAYGTGIMERTESLTLLHDGNVREFGRDELEYGYRHLDLAAGDIILEALFRLDQREAEQTEEEIRKDLELRRAKHSVGFPSAGSFFKNPAGQTAWRLIDATGMRGERVGGAQVSQVHSNFLVNTGGATAGDFLELSRVVKKAVLASCGVTLEEEVRIVGEE